MYRSGPVDRLVTHTNIDGFGLTPLSGDHCGYMPPLLKIKTKLFVHLAKYQGGFLFHQEYNFFNGPPFLTKKS